MIFGIGTDIARTERFKKWINDPEMIQRFFNTKEISDSKNEGYLCGHYAKRFAAKEAFSKALGTGLTGLELKDICVINNETGKPEFELTDTALDKIRKLAGNNYKIHLTLSDEKEYAVAFVVIEITGEESDHDVQKH